VEAGRPNASPLQHIVRIAHAIIVVRMCVSELRQTAEVRCVFAGENDSATRHF
jgi:hypothetical protein